MDLRRGMRPDNPRQDGVFAPRRRCGRRPFPCDHRPHALDCRIRYRTRGASFPEHLQPHEHPLSFKSPLPRLELYVLRESVLPFFLGFGLVTFLFVIDFLFDYLDLILAKGVPFFAVLELFVLALGWITVLSFPCGVLVAALMTFGRLAQDNEITAMRGLGVNVGRVLRGPLLAGLALAALLALYNNYVLPETNHRFANLSLAIHRKRPAAKIEPGIFIDAFENYSLLARKVDDRTGDMQDITIYDYNQGTVPTTILAQRGKMQYIDRGATLKLDLWNGEIHEVPGQTGDNRYRRGRFEQNTIYLHNPGALLQKVDRKSRGDREMTCWHDAGGDRPPREQQSSRLESVDEKARAAGFPSYPAIAHYLRPPDRASVACGSAVTGLLGAGPPALADTAGLAQTLQALELDLKRSETWSGAWAAIGSRSRRNSRSPSPAWYSSWWEGRSVSGPAKAVSPTWRSPSPSSSSTTSSSSPGSSSPTVACSPRPGHVVSRTSCSARWGPTSPSRWSAGAPRGGCAE